MRGDTLRARITLCWRIPAAISFASSRRPRGSDCNKKAPAWGAFYCPGERGNEPFSPSRVENIPHVGACWKARGVTQYRRPCWKEAVICVCC